MHLASCVKGIIAVHGVLEGDWGERRGLNPRPSVPQTDALPAELRSPQTKYTQFRPHSVFSKAGLKDGSGSGCFVGQPLLAVRLRPAEIERDSQEWLSHI